MLAMKTATVAAATAQQRPPAPLPPSSNNGGGLSNGVSTAFDLISSHPSASTSSSQYSTGNNERQHQQQQVQPFVNNWPIAQQQQHQLNGFVNAGSIERRLPNGTTIVSSSSNSAGNNANNNTSQQQLVQQQQPRGLPPIDFPAGMLSDEDLEGGTLLSVEEREEIDPDDGCKIHVWTYHILSADGMEESTITKRRKMKVNCTQSLKRVEYTNGKESKYEEKTFVNNLDTFGPMFGAGVAANGTASIKGGHHHQNALELEHVDDSNEISNLLLHTKDSFLMLLREKKDALVKMFPELFSNLRTLPAIFELMPSIIMETVVNEDGSTTTRTKCSKAFSSHYTRQETFINGIRKECKSRFRAFMEYAGPEGGFCIRLNDNPDADLSEDEEGTELEEDGRSRISSSGTSRSGLSEIQDDEHSALVVTERRGQLCLLPKSAAGTGKEALAKRWEKAWHAVSEIVESEERYVQKLGLLDKFRDEVDSARVLDRRQMGQLFANIASLHQFHEQHLLPQLMDRHREWQSTKRISDVIRKQAPFLKMYSEYTNNYKLATQMFEECMRKKRAFADIVKRIELLPECEHLSLVSHLICPVQRVMRYQLLLREYQKHLNRADPDWSDTEAAVSLVLEAASHANEMMRKLDRYRNVLEVQEQLGNIISLVAPGRELLTKSRLHKCSSNTDKMEERMLFVFTDLLLLASERSASVLLPAGLTGNGSVKYKLRAIFAPKHTQICEGDNLELENSFYLRGSDTETGPQRCVELFCGSQSEKNALFDAVWAVIQEAHSKQQHLTTTNGTDGGNNKMAGGRANGKIATDGRSVEQQQQQKQKCCARCDTDFGWYTRQFGCQRCGQRFCKHCIGPKPHRMCADCMRTATGIRSRSKGVMTHGNHNNNNNSKHSLNGFATATAAASQPRRNLLQMPASPTSIENDVIKASFATFRGPSGKQLQRYFVLRKDFCLYSYRSDTDQCALAMLPLSGTDIGVHQQQPEKFGISIKHMHRAYVLTCANESDHAEWLAALLLSANAKLPVEQQQSGAAAANGDDGDDAVEAAVGLMMRKSATIGFSTGRNTSISHEPDEEQCHSAKTSITAFGNSNINGTNQLLGGEQIGNGPTENNNSNAIVRRSVSVGGAERFGRLEMAMARERVRQLNARNATLQEQQQQQQCARRTTKYEEGTTAATYNGGDANCDGAENRRKQNGTTEVPLRVRMLNGRAAGRGDTVAN